MQGIGVPDIAMPGTAAASGAAANGTVMR